MDGQSLQDLVWLDNPLRRWLLALAVGLGAFLALSLLRTFAARKLAAFARGTATRVDDLLAELVGQARGPFLAVLSLFIGSSILALPDDARRWIRTATIVVVLFQAGIWASRLLAGLLDLRFGDQDGQTASGRAATRILTFVGNLVVWAVVVLVALDNLGVNVTALVAGLGIGGVAVALATQNILGDLFASFSIVLDKPFEAGDFIVLDGLMGHVEQIGIKTTRVRALSGEQIVFSNADLLRSRIRNFKTLKERRMLFSVGVVYRTPPEKLEKISGWLREIVEAQQPVRFDRAHFVRFDDSALIFEVVYFVLDPDHKRSLDIQQAINLAVVRRFAAEGVDLAYPTRTVFVHQAKD